MSARKSVIHIHMPASFSKKHLLAALKKANLPHTHKSLIKYERAGIIPTSANPLSFGVTNTWRLYTAEEIEQIVQKVKDFKS